MANRKVLIDTCVFIDHLRKKNKRETLLWNVKEEYECYLSALSMFELLAGATTSEKTEDIHKLTDWIPQLAMDTATAEKAAEIYRDLRKQNKAIEFRDLFIAATALRNNCQLVTLNQKHFRRIADLSLVAFK